ncbi:MAG: hypothetical protein MSIBF_01705 [Candidatus Altiarchaeales archaeon IMC4]|nr:MAG: hypothetical protein MSIBF_01705 [Candidatus Altiarchaeales archaeon IMC4]
MKNVEIFNAKTDKSAKDFIDCLKVSAKQSGFIVRDIHDMGHIFSENGIAVSDDFNYYMIQICNPEKAYKSLSDNPERGVLIPKFVMVFEDAKNKTTEIRFLNYNADFVKSLFEKDAAFQKSPPESCKTITKI